MTDIIDMIKQHFTESGIENVYSSFDALPIRSKGEIFTVIGMKKFEYSKPVYSQFIVYVPFRAELELSIMSPLGYSMDELCGYYESEISGVLESMSGLNIYVSELALKQDKNISRFVLNVNMSASGIRKIERETEDLQ